MDKKFKVEFYGKYDLKSFTYNFNYLKLNKEEILSLSKRICALQGVYNPFM
jgi:hypothetical protein